ncbi:MAG: hypothetical protein HYV09_32465 [Deltaproteobacteria bacterium]|nr:hypothetical protein [Deltaproteobacteria bacterium]
MTDARRRILERRARFVSAALAGIAVGCGNGHERAQPVDAGAGALVDALVDTARPEACLSPPPDVCLSPAQPDPVGAACDDDGDCQQALGDSFCSTSFGEGPVYPAPVCVSNECDFFDGAIETCGRGTGVCLNAGAGGLCLPMCRFANDGAAPTGCIGKNACNPYGFRVAGGSLQGIGYCFGGCRADEDCPTGSKCQRETGLCVKAPVVYTKPLGAACTSADAKACNCVTGAGGGYCTSVCRFGETACPAGFTCDARLPRPDFDKVPVGLQGYCLKDCTADADCPAGTCLENAGTGRKTCQIGFPLLR